MTRGGLGSRRGKAAPSGGALGAAGRARLEAWNSSAILVPAAQKKAAPEGGRLKVLGEDA